MLEEVERKKQMNWIKVKIHTDLDVLEFWPGSLPACPRVGEFVSTGNGGTSGLKLMVCRVIHCFNNVGEYYADIELTTGPEWQSIKQFNEWYSNKRHL